MAWLHVYASAYKGKRRGSSGSLLQNMVDRRCFSCHSLLSVHNRTDLRAYRRNCCSIFIHHDYIRTEDLAACPSCNIFARGLIWEPLPVVKEPAEAVVVIDSSDEEDEDPIPKKRAKKDGTCVICFE